MAMKMETAEYVLPGHPDKLCDAMADALVDRILAAGGDWRARARKQRRDLCSVEVQMLREFVNVSLHQPHNGWLRKSHEQLDKQWLLSVLKQCGYGRDGWAPFPAQVKMRTTIAHYVLEHEVRDNLFVVCDQAICVGYANAFMETRHLPPAHWLAHALARAVFACRRQHPRQLGPDGKVKVRVRRDGMKWQPEEVVISLSHHEETDPVWMYQTLSEVVEQVCAPFGVPRLWVNSGGPFTCAGPMGDNGSTGRKLVMDFYGPTVPIGGGAMSGKDFFKVDRFGNLLARKLALACVRAELGEEVLVFLEYAPGGLEPEQVRVIADGRDLGSRWKKPLSDPPLWNRLCQESFVKADKPLTELAWWGHWQAGMPWELPFYG